MQTVYEPSAQPTSVKRYVLNTIQTGAGPATINLTLPEQGTYRYHLSVYKNAAGDNAQVDGLVRWYTGDSGTHWVRSVSALLGPDFGQSITGLTLGTPSTGGVCAVTVTYTGTWQVNVQMILEQIAGPAQEYTT